ncbi:MAG TPA: PstS family phosphate ABC transporter substrate-binding protein [Longimicrobiales bacterium]|nr:PstS family phosphate ABC transporter substrate-binding protein [Longimicrobiales bacterium]
MRTATGLVLATAFLAACGGDRAGGDGTGVSGAIAVDGSSTVYPITEAVAEEFGLETGGDVRVTVGVSGTGGGFKRFCAGETDISNASRPIKESEAADCAANGVEYTELTVGIDGLTVAVNNANEFAQCLTVEELRSIWEPGSTINNWSQVRAGFPDQELALYGPGTNSGTFDYFTEEVIGEQGASRGDYTASEDDNVLVQGVEGDPNALGYFGYAYYIENAERMKAVGIDSGNGCVLPNDQTVAGGTYTPLSRPLMIYVNNAKLQQPHVAEFVRFYLESSAELVPQVGYVALEADRYQQELAKLPQTTGVTQP